MAFNRSNPYRFSDNPNSSRPRQEKQDRLSSMEAEVLNDPRMMMQTIASAMMKRSQMTPTKMAALGQTPDFVMPVQQEMRPDAMPGPTFESMMAEPDATGVVGRGRRDEVGYGSPPTRGEEPMTTEEELDMTSRAMGGGMDEEYQWQGTTTPTRADIEYVRQYPTDSVLEDFVDRFGEDQLPSLQPDEDDDYRDTR